MNRLIHYTEVASAISILRQGVIRSSHDVDGYHVNSGPFFFLEGHEDQETPTSLASMQVRLSFECDLKIVKVARDATYNSALESDRRLAYLNAALVEVHPFNGKVTQVRIIPPCTGHLTFIGFEFVSRDYFSSIAWLELKLHSYRRTRIDVERSKAAVRIPRRSARLGSLRQE